MLKFSVSCVLSFSLVFARVHWIVSTLLKTQVNSQSLCFVQILIKWSKMTFPRLKSVKNTKRMQNDFEPKLLIP